MQFAWREREPNLTEIRVRGQRREEERERGERERNSRERNSRERNSRERNSREEERERNSREEEREREKEREKEEREERREEVSSTARSSTFNDLMVPVGCGLINDDNEITPATFSYSKMLQHSLGAFVVLS